MKPIQLKIVNDLMFDFGLPDRASDHSAGYDLRAAIEAPLIVAPSFSCLVPTGVALNTADAGTTALILSRFSLARDFDLVLRNGVGVINADDESEIVALLYNGGLTEYRVNPGDKVAQLLFLTPQQPIMALVSSFNARPRRRHNVDTLGSATLTGTGYAHEPGTQNETPRAFPTDLIGHDDPTTDAGARCPVQDPRETNSVLYPPTGGDEELEQQADD